MSRAPDVHRIGADAAGTSAAVVAAARLLNATLPRLVAERRRARLFAHAPDALAAVVAEPGVPLRALARHWHAVAPRLAAHAFEFGIVHTGAFAIVLPRTHVADLVESAWPELAERLARPTASRGAWTLGVTSAGAALLDLPAGGGLAWWCDDVVVEGNGQFCGGGEA